MQAMLPGTRALLARGRVADGLAMLATAEELAASETDPHLVSLVMALEVNVASQLGDPKRARRVPAGLNLAADAREFAQGEVETSLGLIALQEGDPDAAVAIVERALAALSPDTPTAFGNSTLALARAGAGQPEAAVAAAALVAADSRATYHDRAIALVAQGFAAGQRDDPAERDTAFTDAARVVDATGDVLAQALVRLAHARARWSADEPDADSALTEAQARLTRLGVEATGWDTAFQLAAPAQTGGRPHSPVGA
jgi:hypothetical protein